MTKRALAIVVAMAACGRARSTTQDDVVRAEVALQVAASRKDEIAARAAEDQLRDALDGFAGDGAIARRVHHAREELAKLQSFEVDDRYPDARDALRSDLAGSIHRELSPLLAPAVRAAPLDRATGLRTLARDVGVFCACRTPCVEPARAITVDWESYQDILDDEHDPLVIGVLLLETDCALAQDRQR